MPVKKTAKPKKVATKVKPEEAELAPSPETATIVSEEKMPTEEIKPQELQPTSPSPARVEIEVESGTGQAGSAAPQETVAAPTAEVGAQPTADFAPAPGAVEFSASGGGGWKRWLMIAGILLIAGGLLVGGVMVYKAAIGSPKVTPTPTPTAAPSPSVVPSASPSADLKRGDLSLQVLNGTVTVGYAGKAKAFLQSLGWTNVAVGNAQASDLVATEIEIKEDKKVSYGGMLSEDLSQRYVVNDQIKTLDGDSKYDAVITLGSQEVE